MQLLIKPMGTEPVSFAATTPILMRMSKPINHSVTHHNRSAFGHANRSRRCGDRRASAARLRRTTVFTGSEGTPFFPSCQKVYATPRIPTGCQRRSVNGLSMTRSRLRVISAEPTKLI